MSDRVWIVNSSPLIALAKIGQLDLLTAMAERVLIPAAVVEEILSGPEIDPARQALEAGWGERLPAVETPVELVSLDLDPGETAVLTAALQLGDCTVVLDDGKARRAAKKLGMSVIGTVGIVLRARREGQLASAGDAFVRLMTIGLYLPEDLIREALKEFGEVW